MSTCGINRLPIKPCCPDTFAEIEDALTRDGRKHGVVIGDAAPRARDSASLKRDVMGPQAVRRRVAGGGWRSPTASSP